MTHEVFYCKWNRAITRFRLWSPGWFVSLYGGILVNQGGVLKCIDNSRRCIRDFHFITWESQTMELIQMQCLIFAYLNSEIFLDILSISMALSSLDFKKFVESIFEWAVHFEFCIRMPEIPSDLSVMFSLPTWKCSSPTWKCSPHQFFQFAVISSSLPNLIVALVLYMLQRRET